MFLSVNLDYCANLLTFVVPSHNLNFIILSDGHRSNTVLLSPLFGKRGGHTSSVNVGRRIEMPFAVTASVRRHKEIELHFISATPTSVTATKRAPLVINVFFQLKRLNYIAWHIVEENCAALNISISPSHAQKYSDYKNIPIYKD